MTGLFHKLGVVQIVQKNVLVLAGEGMLGLQVVKTLRGEKNFTVLSSSRKAWAKDQGQQNYKYFDVLVDNLNDVFGSAEQYDYVINCIGVTKPNIVDHDQKSRSVAIEVNSMFPYLLSKWALSGNTRVIQIATDCVFSGRHGNYSEVSSHDPIDVYGKTKSLGEVPSPNVMNLRTSTIGREYTKNTLLLEWVLNQPANAQILGFKNHLWNGVTTNAFARVIRGIIQSGSFFPGLQHLVPANITSKDELVRLIANKYDRTDLMISSTYADESIDRTLSTNHDDVNKLLWVNAGYSTVPTIQNLLSEVE